MPSREPHADARLPMIEAATGRALGSGPGGAWFEVYVVWAAWALPSLPAVRACRELALSWARSSGSFGSAGSSGSAGGPGIPHTVGLCELPFGISVPEVRLELLRGDALAEPHSFLTKECGVTASTPLPSWVFVYRTGERAHSPLVEVFSGAMPKFHVKTAYEDFVAQALGRA